MLAINLCTNPLWKAAGCRPLTPPLPHLSMHSETSHILGKLPPTWKKKNNIKYGLSALTFLSMFGFAFIPEHIHGQNLTMTSAHTAFVSSALKVKETCTCLPYRVKRIKPRILAGQCFSTWTITVAAAFMTK